MAPTEKRRKDRTPEEKAAHGGDGQEQEPKQAQEESSGVWDGDQHSDAPGPFGTVGG